MSRFELPELAPNATPEFSDASSAKSWVEHLPLANTVAAQRLLLAQVRELNRCAVRAASRLAALEAVREAVNFVQLEQAKRFSNHALPLAKDEAYTFERTVELWAEMALGYLRCLDAATGEEGKLRSQAGMICQRVLACIGLGMLHHHRAYREIPAPMWRRLHRVYAEAEALGVADDPVKDYLNRDVQETSPRVAYVRAVLTAAASPGELTQRELSFVAFLLERWAHKVVVLRDPVHDRRVPCLVVDLAGESEALPLLSVGGSRRVAEPRFLDVRGLARSLSLRVEQLRKGESPARLGLGEDCARPACEQLLDFLLGRWCRAVAPRAERRSADAAVRVCNELAGIHYHLSGGAFRQPGHGRELTHRQREEMETLGRVISRDEDELKAEATYAPEDWRFEDLGAQGIRLQRVSDGGRRYLHGQLLGVFAASGNLMLGQLRWVLCGADGALSAGVRILPGRPAAVAARPFDSGATDKPCVPALSLTASEAHKSPPALVLPVGWYRPKCVIEVFSDHAERVELTELLERGTDFERVAYAALPA